MTKGMNQAGFFVYLTQILGFATGDLTNYSPGWPKTGPVYLIYGNKYSFPWKTSGSSPDKATIDRLRTYYETELDLE